MFNVSIYLEKFRAIKDPRIFKREIVDTLNKITGNLLSEKEISYKKGVVMVEADSMMRSEIFQKKAELVEKLSGSFTVSDIR